MIFFDGNLLVFGLDKMYLWSLKIYKVCYDFSFVIFELKVEKECFSFFFK